MVIIMNVLNEKAYKSNILMLHKVLQGIQKKYLALNEKQDQNAPDQGLAKQCSNKNK